MSESNSPMLRMKMLPSQASPLRMTLIGVGAVVLLVLVFGFSFGALHTGPLNLPNDNAGYGGLDGDSTFQDVYNQTLGFQKIYVINLPHRFDHRDSMSLAARLTGLQVEYVDGVLLSNDSRAYLPPMPPNNKMGNTAIGAYRAHMNVLRKIIEENITSALVLEGDVDWDIRIKSQMHAFAKASRMLLQPGQEDRRWDITETLPSDSHRSSASSSPYGDINQWDFSWLGHCGARFPPDSNDHVPLGRVEFRDDITVPEQQHIEVQYGGKAIVDEYPPHTRVASRAWGNVCSLAYGITQPGAQKFFYELGIRKLNSAADLMFRQLCGDHGKNPHDRPTERCLTVQPQLFQHHRPIAPKSTFSDIGNHGDHYNEVAFTRNVRWSTRINFSKLVRGDINYTDQFLDGAPAQDFEPDLHEPVDDNRP